TVKYTCRPFVFWLPSARSLPRPLLCSLLTSGIRRQRLDRLLQKRSVSWHLIRRPFLHPYLTPFLANITSRLRPQSSFPFHERVRLAVPQFRPLSKNWTAAETWKRQPSRH